ncbi:MAG TPA: response regulator [Candidatus Sulfotelmatobacter sp.]|nr:response regulator [Candidatus Sulfotelmatobacter sp.]
MNSPHTIAILQVEDEEADITLLQYVFRQAGIQVPLRAVTDGQMAIDYLSGAGPFADRATYPLPCLILLDLKLPKLTGLEVLAWLRQQPRLKRTVVIVFSSSAQLGDVERAYDLGANSFIQKPPDLEHTREIAQLLKAWWLGYNCFPLSCEVPGGTADQL